MKYQSSNKFLILNSKDFLIVLITSSKTPAITCSKLTIETLEEGVKYVQS